jgi:acetyl-CoA carboxylase, biotin carboxylase subunit
MFEKVLIANRGEIAVRVVRACRELGISTVVVHSTRDSGSTAARLADEKVCIGPPSAKLSYLNAAMVLQAALNTRADAIHPGYGFLSEDPEFAEACERLGITLIGPPASVLAVLGGKDRARTAMAQAGLPLLPGSTGPLDLAGATRLAERIGFPLLIKSVAGGGGRGMAVAENPAELPLVFQRVQASAAKLFTDDRVYAERYLRHARHVEVQVLADRHGGVIHLGERDCSMQRRRQKLVEESPAPALPARVVERIRGAAVDGAKAAGYQGAGTFEFIVDDELGFYFMEVNCRIQVEHPVTEMVTGIDLVSEQIRIAAGSSLAISQSDVELRGAAIECRINAEDPGRHFAPAPGTITELALPGGPFVRVDTHVHPGYSVPPEYDPLIAKVIVWAPDRGTAIARMRRALRETTISGPGLHTTVEFLDSLLGAREFGDAEHSTSYVDQLTQGGPDWLPAVAWHGPESSRSCARDGGLPGPGRGGHNFVPVALDEVQVLLRLLFRHSAIAQRSGDLECYNVEIVIRCDHVCMGLTHVPAWVALGSAGFLDRPRSDHELERGTGILLVHLPHVGVLVSRDIVVKPVRQYIHHDSDSGDPPKALIEGRGLC